VVATSKMQERADEMRPRIARVINWALAKWDDLNLAAPDDDEIKATEALFNAEWLNYVTGGPEEPVKEALLKWVEAHRGKKSDNGRQLELIPREKPTSGILSDPA